MAIDPIKIPQNVYIEDRIIGSVTLKQIIVTGIGAGFSYALYTLVSRQMGAPPLPLTILIWLPAAVAAFFAFVRINDIGMFQLLLLMIERANKPAMRVQTPRRGIVINVRTFTKPANEEKAGKGTTVQRRDVRFDELSAAVDTPLNRLHGEEEKEPDMPAEDLEEPVLHLMKEQETPQTILPVNPSRVTADQGTAVTSVFRDLSPAPR